MDFGLQMNIFTINAAANACLDDSWSLALHLLGRAAGDGMLLNTVSYNVLVSACESGGVVRIRDSLLGGMREAEILPSLVTYNSLINLCGVDGAWTAAFTYLQELWQNSCEPQPDIVSYNSAIRVCQRCSQWQPALSFLMDAEQHGLKLDALTFGATIASAAKSRNWGCATSLLQVLWPAGYRGAHANVVVCSSACDALAQVKWEGAVNLLADMRDFALLPNAFTLCCSIGGCGRGQQWSRSLSLQLGKEHSGVCQKTLLTVAQLPAPAACFPRLRLPQRSNTVHVLPEAVSAMGACAQADRVSP